MTHLSLDTYMGANKAPRKNKTYLVSINNQKLLWTFARAALSSGVYIREF